MENKRTALQQAYLERAQVLKETEGAPESTRVALSAISGRNILKTKQETAKIERDKQIAAMQQQAMVQQWAAGSALKMAQHKLSAAIQEDQNRRSDAFRFMDAGIYGDTLADVLDADATTLKKYAEIQKQNSALEQQKRSEALSILEMGVYDPSVAHVLGFSEEVVKAFADRRAAEIADVRAKQKAAAQAQTDYEAVLNNDKRTAVGGGDKKSVWSAKVDAAIDTFEASGTDVTDANAAKEQILGTINTDVVMPWAESSRIDLSGKSAGQLLFDMPAGSATKQAENVAGSGAVQRDLAFGFFSESDYDKENTAPESNPQRAKAKRDEEKRTSEGVNKKEAADRAAETAKERREKEKEAARKNKEAVERDYERAMAKRVVTKEDAGEELTPLQKLYKETDVGKVYIAKEKISSAKTGEELISAYQAYAEQITTSYNNVVGKAKEGLETAFARYEAGENLTDEELTAVLALQSEMNGIKTILQDAVDSGLLTSESEQGYLDGISNIEKVISSLDAMELYADTYNEDDASYRVMDEQYGERTLEELEAEADRLEQELSQEYDVEVNPTSELSRAKGMMGEINKENDPRYETLQNLQKYIERRKSIEETAEENRKAILLSSDFEGDTEAERISNAIDSVGAEINEVYFYKMYHGTTDEGDEDIYIKIHEVNPNKIGRDEVLVDGEKTEIYYYRAKNGEKWLLSSYVKGLPAEYRSYSDVLKINDVNLKKQQILTNAYHRLSEDGAVELLEGVDIDQMVLDFAKEYDSKKFRSDTNYTYGDAYKSNGWYGSFYTDVDRFVIGEYGWFDESDAKTVLALFQVAGDDKTKQDIAFNYYTKALERAKQNEAGALGGGKWAAGIVAGPIEFLANGVFMLANAATKDYSRVQKTMFSAAHQLTMEEFSQKTGILNDSLEFLYQAGYTVVDMVPVVALSAIPYVGKVASSGYLYAKVLATTYDDSIRNGKRADEAFTYATLTAVSEVVLEKAFSGIAKVGGSKSVGNLWKKAVEKLSTTSGVKTALKIAGNMGSEGFEEFLQEVLSPFLEKVAADVNGMTDAELGEIDWEEAGKSFLLGAFTGGFFGAFELGGADQSAILSKIALQGEGKDAIKIIQMAADLGNRRAIRIKEAMQNKTPLYKDQAGVRQYASESDITNLRKSIRRKNKKALLQNIRAELEADATRDHSKNSRIYNIFKELLLNHRVDVYQMADLINDPVALKILNRITGKNVGAMMPTDAMYLARLASFTDQNGQVDQARIDALKDSFGELDYKAIEQILKYEDIVAEQRAEGNFSGVLYEDSAVQETLTEEQREAIEEMEMISGMTGKFYLISDQYKSGSYLSKDVVTIRTEDVGKGAFYLLGHKAYYMMLQMNAEKANVVKNVLFDYVEEMIGEQGIELEKKKLRQQGFDEAVLDDELCARMMPVVFLQGDYKIVEEIAKEDIEAANQLRSVIGSIREHLANNYEEKISKSKNSKFLSQEYIDEMLEGFDIKNPGDWQQVQKRVMETLVDEGFFTNAEFRNRVEVNSESGMAIEINKSGIDETFDIQNYGRIGRWKKLAKLAIIRRLPEIIKNGHVVLNNAPNMYGGTAKNKQFAYIEHTLEEDGKSMTIRLDIKKSPQKNKFWVHKVIDIKSVSSSPASTKNGTEAGQTTADNKEMVSQFDKNVNSSFYQSLFDLAGQETTELYDRLSEAVENHYAVERAVGTERDPSAIFDGSEFTYADGERIAEENDGATWVKEFENMSPHEREVAIARQRADIDDLLALLTETERRIEAEDHTADEELVTTETSENKISIGESVSESWNFIRRRVTDVGATVYDIAKKTKDWKLYHYFNYARSSSNTAIKMVEDKQTDIAGNVVGKGLNEIFKPIMDRGAIFYRDFQLYLFHMHNVDRMSRESQQNIEAANDAFGFVVDMYPELRKYSEREILEISRDIGHPDNMGAVDYITALRNKEYWSNLQNKPIFGYKVTAEISKGKAEDLLRRYPEFKELAKEVYQYSDNLMQYRVDSGLITKEFAAKLKEIYPHYVPTARVEGGSADAINAVSVGNKAIIGKTVGRAQGGDAMLIPLHKQFADQTMAVVREGSKNRFGSMLLDMAFDDAVPQVRKIEKTADRMSGIVSFDGQIDTVDPFKTEEFENIFVVYKDGEQYFMEVTPDLYEAAKSLSPNKEETNKFTRAARKANDLYKRLITGYNPAFAIRNFSRDIQDALLYTKDLKGFIKNYPLAWKEILSKGEYWRKYQALGGTYSSVFDYKSGRVQKGKPIASQIEAVNMAIEQVARLAEFMSTVKKGDGGMDNLMEAMYNAAEITTNFGRSGKWGGFLNKNFVPFLNPSIQGFSKICRTLTETKGFRPWFFLVTKAAFLGWVIPSVLNGLLWGDDDEWDLIKQRDKDLNYLFKVKDGVWLKVPKGRVLSVLGMAGHRIQQEIQGEDADWGEFIATASSQVSPTNPLTNNIVTPFVGVVSNRNWYGGEIVGQSLQNLPKAEQYDAKTDVISIWLGEVLNVSPKKINYLLDQYTGVIGDIVLPALSVASERGFWENAFTIDTDYSNRLSGDFYDQLQELNEKKNSVSGTAEDAAKYRWWNRKAGELSEVNKKINEVQADSSLTKKEKEDELKLLYASRNAIILKAEEEAETYFGAVEDIADGMDLSSDDAADVLYREANRKAFGAEEALKMYNKDTYERAVKARDEQGIDFDTFFDVYFDKSVDCDHVFKLIEHGVSKDGAMEIGRSLDALEPEGASESVTYLQKYDAIIGANVGDDEKLAAINAFANDTDRRRVTIGVGYGISLEQFVGIKRNIQRLNDADGKTTASNARIEAAIRYEKGLTDQQRAVLWQLFTSSNSAKNNPFSYSVGAETLAKVKVYKENEE